MSKRKHRCDDVDGDPIEGPLVQCKSYNTRIFPEIQKNQCTAGDGRYWVCRRHAKSLGAYWNNLKKE